MELSYKANLSNLPRFGPPGCLSNVDLNLNDRQDRQILKFKANEAAHRFAQPKNLSVPTWCKYYKLKINKLTLLRSRISQILS